MTGIDARAARLRFARAAATYEAASPLEREVGRRLLERLDYVRIAPRWIVDAGAGAGRDASALAARYPAARVLAVDFALPLLRAGRPGVLWRWRDRRHFACADIARLPLASGSVQLVWSNMALHWAADPPAVVRELSRVLEPGGLLTFATLGPDTLKELRAIAPGRVHAFVDMHDIGDMLVAARLSQPVMDMEMVRLQYASGARLLEDLRASGQTNARSDRARGLSGRRFGAMVRALLAAPLEASFEVVYGHAWKDAPRKDESGRDIVKFPALDKRGARGVS